MPDGPIQRLPFRTSHGTPEEAQVEFLPMTTALASAWHTEVQTIVDVSYAPGASAWTRADVGWNWKRIRGLAIAHSLFLEPVAALALIVRDDQGTPFPVGMLTAVPQLWTDVQNVSRHRSFTWYLADAPTELYANLGISPLFGVARALIDESIKQAKRLGDDGAMVLHADPAGGARLQKFYAGKCGMTQLTAGHPPICPLRSLKWNASEYFTLGASASVNFCSFQDGLR